MHGKEIRFRMERDMNYAVEVEKVVKRYKELLALDHFSLKIKEGEIFGLLGPNGSGKTTTINCILSLLSYDKGEIKVFGKQMKPSSYDIKKDIGVVLQNVAVFEQLTVYENVDYFCGLYVKNRGLRKQYVEEALEFAGLSDYRKFLPKKLSGGLLRRLNIACGIAHKPKLIFFDEPTVAVDPQSRNRILEGIEKLNKNGATIVYTSHYMEEVERLCNRILIMDKGRSVATGTADELKKMIKNTETITVEAIGIEMAQLERIRGLECVYEVIYENSSLTVRYSGGRHNLVSLISCLNQMNIAFGSVYSKLPTLNDVFLEITGRQLRD